ncbi:hypothetical protein [Sphaerisporangium sp. TRM90804]|uniref:hypothetical protein n=1 Tax=Sphaerisporangium sp. TRM90804 TaxID=3031113 RepID=UPI00244B9467|nr:hypothetical protein [Sphaerisporangium sp. TRM90804]MDH2430258.1 hypothetical protein [Sphaerisporangium sp. TRM90804]
MAARLRTTAALALASSLLLGAGGCAAVERGAAGVLEAVGDPSVITADKPFAGSPAEKFADGKAGMVIPQAARVGRFTAKEVSYAYRKTRNILAAAYLDRPTLLGGRAAAYARQLHPEQAKDFRAKLDRKDQSQNSRGWVMSFAKGKAELVGQVIKVRGTMSAAEGKDEEGRPELWVRFEYRFVYPVRKPGTSAIVRVMAYEKARVSFWRNPATGRLDPWHDDAEDKWTAGVECEPEDGFVYPAYPDSTSGGGRGTAPAEDPFAKPSAPMKDGDCPDVEGV